MAHKPSPEELYSYLPQYVNGTLPPGLCSDIDAWLAEDDSARDELAAWQRMHQAVASQPLETLSPRAWAMITVNRRSSRRSSWSWTRFLVGASLAMLTLIMLWLTLRPGVVLQWSVSDDSPVVYQIYRAPLGSQSFELLDELDAELGVQDYSYLDIAQFPGQAYIYRIQAISPSGSLLFTNTVTSQPLGVLPGQLAIILASIAAGLLAASALHPAAAHQREHFLPA